MLPQHNYGRGYPDLRRGVVRQLKKARVQHQVFQVLAAALETVLAEEPIILSRAQRKRLLAHVTADILGDMLQKLDRSSAGAE